MSLIGNLRRRGQVLQTSGNSWERHTSYRTSAQNQIARILWVHSSEATSLLEVAIRRLILTPSFAMRGPTSLYGPAQSPGETKRAQRVRYQQGSSCSRSERRQIGMRSPRARLQDSLHSDHLSLVWLLCIHDSPCHHCDRQGERAVAGTCNPSELSGSGKERPIFNRGLLSWKRRLS